MSRSGRGRNLLSRLNDSMEFLAEGGNANNQPGIGGFYEFLHTNFAGQHVRIATGGADGRLYDQGDYYISDVASEFSDAFGRLMVGGIVNLLFIDSDVTLVHGPGTRAVVYPGRKIAQRRLEQRWRTGELNCVLGPILKVLKAKHASYSEKMPGPSASNYKARLKQLKKHEKRVSNCEEFMVKALEEGVGEDFLTEICESLNVEVTIFAALQGRNKDSMVICTRSSTKSASDRLKFNFINGAIHHVEPLPCHKDYAKLSYFPMDKPEMLSAVEMKAKYEELKASNAIYRYRVGHGEITAIATPTLLYRLEDDFVTVLSTFMKETTLDAGQLCMLKDREVSQFIKRGVHGNGTVDKSILPCTYSKMLLHPEDYVRELVEIKLARANSKSIDMKRAYTQGRKCDQYVGYPHKITDFRVTDKIEGVGYYFVKSFDWSIAYTKHERFYEIEKFFLNCFRGMDVYASPLLTFLKQFDVGMDIVYGAWGTSIDLDFNDHPEMMEKYRGKISDDGEITGGQRGYALGVGMMQCLRPNNTWYVDVEEADIPLFENYRFQHDLNCPRMQFFSDGKLGATYERKSISHSLHVAGFITAYVTLNMFKMLLNCGVPVEKMLRVCSDGAYFDVPDIRDITFDPELFAEKEVKIDPSGASGSFSNGAADTYTGQSHSENSIDFFERLESGDPLLCRITRPHHQFSAVLGAGGCAKSAITLRDVFVEGGCEQQFGEVGNGGLVKAMFFAPSHKLRSDKQGEYAHLSTMCWQALFGGNFDTQRKYSSKNVWIIDECSMLLKQGQFAIMAKAENLGIKVIFLGDPGFQAAPVPLIDKATGIINTEEFDVSYFKEGVNLQTLTVNYRFKCQILANFCLELRRLITERVAAYVGYRFVLNFPGIQHVNLEQVKQSYTLGDWILVRTHDIEEVYTELFPDLERYQVVANGKGFYNGCITFEKPDDSVKCKRTHASTMHAVQGITVKRPLKLFIDMSRAIELRVLYTALSRPETFDQIYLVVDDRVKRQRYDTPAICEVDSVDPDECFFW